MADNARLRRLFERLNPGWTCEHCCAGAGDGGVDPLRPPRCLRACAWHIYADEEGDRWYASVDFTSPDDDKLLRQMSHSPVVRETQYEAYALGVLLRCTHPVVTLRQLEAELADAPMDWLRIGTLRARALAVQAAEMLASTPNNNQCM